MVPKRRKKRTGSSTATATRAAVHKGSRRLSKAELREFRRLLLEKRRSLVGDLNGITAEARCSPVRELRGGPSAGPSSLPYLPDDSTGAETTLGLLAHERTLLREIDEALDRIENGTYGVCRATGKPIGKARLRARPWAMYCIEYARTIEGRRAPARHPPSSWQEGPPSLRNAEEEEKDLDDLLDLANLEAVEDTDPPMDF